MRKGDVVGGYRLIEQLGRGAMGEVWRAGSESGDEVALKLLSAELLRRRRAVARFEREGKILERLDSPHLCRLLALGSEPRPYLVFELVSGETLQARLGRERSIAFAVAFPLIADVWSGVADAHRERVIHRDIKPSNVIIERSASGRERARLLDFGVSKLLDPDDDEGDSLTSEGGVVGSFSYMAPEQVVGASKAGPAADVYAVASTAFAALAGRPPHDAPTAAALIELKLSEPAPTLIEVTGHVWPEAVESFFSRALASDPEHRFDAAGALRAWMALEREEAAVPHEFRAERASTDPDTVELEGDPFISPRERARQKR